MLFFGSEGKVFWNNAGGEGSDSTVSTAAATVVVV
jgi:hypothetical protein